MKPRKPKQGVRHPNARLSKQSRKTRNASYCMSMRSTNENAWSLRFENDGLTKKRLSGQALRTAADRRNTGQQVWPDILLNGITANVGPGDREYQPRPSSRSRTFLLIRARISCPASERLADGHRAGISSIENIAAP